MTQIFINIFIIYYRKRGDRGKDIDGKITSIPFIIQCKNYLYRKIGPEVVQQLEGVLSQELKNTIGILVIPNRNDYTKRVIEVARESFYNILLTDKNSIIIDLLEFTININKNN